MATTRRWWRWRTRICVPLGPSCNPVSPTPRNGHDPPERLAIASRQLRAMTNSRWQDRSDRHPENLFKIRVGKDRIVDEDGMRGFHRGWGNSKDSRTEAEYMYATDFLLPCLQAVLRLSWTRLSNAGGMNRMSATARPDAKQVEVAVEMPERASCNGKAASGTALSAALEVGIGDHENCGMNLTPFNKGNHICS